MNGERKKIRILNIRGTEAQVTALFAALHTAGINGAQAYCTDTLRLAIQDGDAIRYLNTAAVTGGNLLSL